MLIVRQQAHLLIQLSSMFLLRPFLYLTTIFTFALALNAAPEVKILPETTFLGILLPEEAREGAILIQNVGKTDLDLIKADAECGCTTPHFEAQTLKSQGVYNVSFTFKEIHEGYFERKITVTTSQGPITLLLSGFVSKDATVATPYPNVGLSDKVTTVPVFYTDAIPEPRLPEGAKLVKKEGVLTNIPLPYVELSFEPNSVSVPTPITFLNSTAVFWITPQAKEEFTSVPATVNLGVTALGSKKSGILTIKGPIGNLEARSPSLQLKVIGRNETSLRIMYTFYPTVEGLINGEVALVDPATDTKHFSITVLAKAVK